MRLWNTFAIALLLAACSKTSTQGLLDADLIVSGRSAIKLSTPANGATILSEASLVFSWGDIPGAGNYLIEIADSSGFSNIILSRQVSTNEYPFQRSDLKSGATFGSSSYYWRVSINSGGKTLLRSDIWVANFIADNAFYVDCAFTGTSYGTRLAPFKTIQTGLDSALGARLGVATATAEVRVAKGTCSESIILRANVLLKGGYDPSQNWARNPALYQSILSTTNAVAVQGFADLTTSHTSTLMEGFKIQTTNTGTTVLASVVLTSSTMTFKNNYFLYSTVISQVGLGISLMSISRGTITLDSNIFSATTPSSTANHLLDGLYFEGSTVTARNNIFYLSANAGGISSNLIHGDITGSASTAFNATNNTFFQTCSSAPNLCLVIGLNLGGAGTFSGTFERNVVYRLGPAGSNRCGAQTGGAKLTTFKDNAMADCNGNGNGFWYATTNIGAAYAAPWTAAVGATAAASANLDTALTNGLANNPTGCSSAPACSASITGNRGGNTVPGTPTLPGTPSVVFQGYAAGDPTTFTFKPNTIADMDNNGAYDASIDAGANTTTAGLVALP